MRRGMKLFICTQLYYGLSMIFQHILSFLGWSVKGLLTCSYYKDDICYERVECSCKQVYIGHRRFLDAAIILDVIRDLWMEPLKNARNTEVAYWEYNLLSVFDITNVFSLSKWKIYSVSSNLLYLHFLFSL